MSLVYLFGLIILSVAYGAEEKCECNVEKDYLIVFDDFQTADNLWGTQVFVSKFGRALRSLHKRNRVAVATMSEMKSKFEESKYRRSNAFEQAILDLDLSPAPEPTLKVGLNYSQEWVKDGRKDKSLITIYIIASKGKAASDDMDTEQIARSLSRKVANRNYVGFVVTIGKEIHEGTIAALTKTEGGEKDDSKLFAVNSVRDLGPISFKLTVGVCESRSTAEHFGSTGAPSSNMIELFESTGLNGGSYKLQLEPGRCHNTDGMPTFQSQVKEGTLNWGDNVGSIQNHDTCVEIYTGKDCEGEEELLEANMGGESFKKGTKFYHNVGAVKTCE